MVDYDDTANDFLHFFMLKTVPVLRTMNMGHVEHLNEDTADKTCHFVPPVAGTDHGITMEFNAIKDQSRFRKILAESLQNRPITDSNDPQIMGYQISSTYLWQFMGLPLLQNRKEKWVTRPLLTSSS
jgi:hypothetical protein